MKREMGNLLEKRKNLSMSDIAAKELLQKCRNQLGVEDLKVIDAKVTTLERQHQAGDADIPWIDWKVTLHLKTLLEHCVDKLSKMAKQ